MENRNNGKGKRAAARGSRLRRMFESRGVYIALCSLAVIIGIFAYVGRAARRTGSNVSFDDAAWQKAVSESKIESESELDNGEDSSDADGRTDRDAEEGADGTADGGSAMKEIKPSGADSSAAQTAVPRENVIDVDAAAVKASAQVAAPAAQSDSGMSEPCVGRVIAECSLDDLVYCAAMDDWRTHNGIDYAAAEGESVHAAAAGTVSRVYSDDMLGATVVIDHGDGISTLYGSLADIDSVKVGASVAKGDVIGTVGKSCALEKNLEPHLHFEVLKDGNPENPDVHFAS